MTQTQVTTKKFTLLQLFSIVDGRLSTGMDDVYDILGHIYKFPGIMTHHLPTAMKYIKELNPTWYKGLVDQLNAIKAIPGVGNEFEHLIEYIKKHNDEYEIPQIEDGEAFGKYMVDNSLLMKIDSK